MTRTVEPAAAPVPTGPAAPSAPVARLLARGAFALIYVGVQLGFLLTSSARPDGVFSFQMFNESSRLQIELYRLVRSRSGVERRVRVVDGRWTARGPDGRRREFRWYDRVRDRTVGVLDREQHAPYGLDAQLFRLRAALDDVARHLDGDRETVALLARVKASKNGRDPVWYEYRSPRQAE